MDGGLHLRHRHHHHPDSQQHQQQPHKKAPLGGASIPSTPSASSGPSCSADNTTTVDTQHLMPRGDQPPPGGGLLPFGSFTSAAALPGLPALRALRHSSSIGSGVSLSQLSQLATVAAACESPEDIEELMRTVSGARQGIRDMRVHLLAQQQRQQLARRLQATAKAREVPRAALSAPGCAAGGAAAASGEQQEPPSPSTSPTPRSTATNVADQLMELAGAQRSCREAAAASGANTPGPLCAAAALSLVAPTTASVLHALPAPRPVVDHRRLVQLMHDFYDAKQQAKACINEVDGLLGVLSPRRKERGEQGAAPASAPCPAGGHGLRKRPLDTEADAAADQAGAPDEPPAKKMQRAAAAVADTRDSVCSDTSAGPGVAASVGDDEQLGPEAPAANQAVGAQAASALQNSTCTVVSLLRVCRELAAVVAPCADDASAARAAAAEMAAQRDQAAARLRDANAALQLTRQQLALAKSYVAMKSQSAQRLQQDAQAAAAAHTLQTQRMGGVLQRLMEVAGSDSLPLAEKHALVGIATYLFKVMA